MSPDLCLPSRCQGENVRKAVRRRGTEVPRPSEPPRVLEDCQPRPTTPVGLRSRCDAVALATCFPEQLFVPRESLRPSRTPEPPGEIREAVTGRGRRTASSVAVLLFLLAFASPPFTASVVAGHLPGFSGHFSGRGEHVCHSAAWE